MVYFVALSRCGLLALLFRVAAVSVRVGAMLGCSAAVRVFDASVCVFGALFCACFVFSLLMSTSNCACWRNSSKVTNPTKPQGVHIIFCPHGFAASLASCFTTVFD